MQQDAPKKMCLLSFHVSHTRTFPYTAPLPCYQSFSELSILANPFAWSFAAPNLAPLLPASSVPVPFPAD